MKHKFSSMGRVAIALVLALSLSLVMAVPVSAQGALTGVSATPADATETVTTTYTLAFTTATAGEIDTIEMLFHSDYDVSSVSGTATVTGIGAGTANDVGDAVIYEVTDPQLIPVGRSITIALSGIVNPATAGDYAPAVTVTTKIEAGGAIDTGSADVTITPKPVSFEVVAGTVTVGEAFSVTITAKDAAEGDGDTVAGYAGDHLIDFTYDPAGTGTLPAFEVITFAEGIGISSQSFILTDITQTTAQIKANDTALTVIGFSAVITINPGALAGFTISGAPVSSVEAGTAFTNITVTAVDADDEPVTDYTGTVSWSSTDDPIAELPADYTFIAEDDGEKLFDGATDFILKTVLLEEGTPIATTITITDETAGVSQESIDITVGPATASQWTVVAVPTSIRADNVNASTITATAYDEFGNVATGYDTTTATFSESLGTLSGATDFSAGVATATLKSNGVVGTATVKVVDSGAMPDKTVAVTLLAPDLLAEVWVDATDGAAGNPGTEAEPFATIQAGMAATAEGGIVNVAAGTYSAPFEIDKQLTLKGANYGVSAVTGDRSAESIIDVGALDAVDISASGVILDGFMITGDTGGDDDYRVRAESGSTTDGVQIRNNIINPGAYQGIFTWSDTTTSNWIISNNTVAADGTAVLLSSAGTTNTISDNLIGAGGIGVSGPAVNTTIENNTISNTNDGGSGVSLDGAADGVTITGNTFSGELHTNGGNGVRLWSPTKVSTFAIHQNNFVSDFGAGFAVNNGTVDQVDATNNWWGNDSGPEHVLNPDGTGEPIDGNVDFTPWLTAAYAEPVDPVDPVTTATITLDAGYNLVSLSLIPDVPGIDTMTVSLTELEKIYRYDALAETPDWLVYNPGAPFPGGSDLLTMDDDWGYWVKMTDSGSFTFSGSELVAGPEDLPPSYDVVEGWNLIGFKSTTTSSIAAYLGDVSETLDAIYGYQDGAFFIPTELDPGLGYWIAVTDLGTIYP